MNINYHFRWFCLNLKNKHAQTILVGCHLSSHAGTQEVDHKNIDVFVFFPFQPLSRMKQTINISAYIDACKTLKVPEEEVSFFFLNQSYIITTFTIVSSCALREISLN